MPLPRSLAAGAALAVALSAPVVADAATITVTTTADAVAADGVCSLREAITAANANAAPAAPGECAAGEAGGADRIVLPAGTYRRTLGGVGEDANGAGDLDVTGPLEILGAGAGVTVIDAAGLDRVIDVRTSGSVRIADVTLTGGATPAGAAAAPVAGAPGSPDPVAGGSGGDAEEGAGVRNLGALTIERSRISGNAAGAGGRGGDATGAGGVAEGQAGGTAAGGPGGAGGAGGIWTSGSLTLSTSVVSGNRGGAGGAGGVGRGGNGASGLTPSVGGDGVGGAGGAGGPGGIEAHGTLAIRDGAILVNQSGAGGQGGDGFGGAAGPGEGGERGGGGTGEAGGPGGAGGGVRVIANATIERTTIASNTTGPGGQGGNGRGGARSGSADIGPGIGGDGGSGGRGGGVATAAGTIAMTNVTLAGNITAGGGGGGGGGFGFQGGPGSVAGQGGPGGTGGGLHAGGGAVHGSFATVAGNGVGTAGTAGSANTVGTPGSAGSSGSPGIGASAAVSGDVPVGLTASILSNNGCAPAAPMQDGGANLVQSALGCPGSPADARLGPLTANGGVPPTLALGPGSTAVDHVPAVVPCPATDARGATRPVGAACDAGAYEVAPPVPVTGGVTLSGSTARIAGTVTTRGLPTQVRVQIGRTSAYGTDTPLVTIPGEASPTAVAVSVGGLVALQTYHYRLIASGPDGTVAGADRTFTVPRPGTTALARPRLLGLTVRPRAFAPVPRGGGRTAARKGRPAFGTLITFRLSERATVRITVTRVVRGRLVRAGKSMRCRVVGARARVVRGKRCSATRTLGTVRRAGAAGRNRFVMTGRVGAKALAPGAYRLTFVATDADGERSAPARAAIRILPAPRPPRRSARAG